jgi:hypothetical protein
MFQRKANQMWVKPQPKKKWKHEREGEKNGEEKNEIKRKYKKKPWLQKKKPTLKKKKIKKDLRKQNKTQNNKRQLKKTQGKKSIIFFVENQEILFLILKRISFASKTKKDEPKMIDKRPVVL